MDAKTIKIGGESVTLKMTNRAQFRLASLPTSPNLSKPHQAYAAICVYLWAMLPKELHHKYPQPEDVADEIDADKVVEIGTLVFEAVFPQPEKKEDSLKNGSAGRKRKSASKPG